MNTLKTVAVYIQAFAVLVVLLRTIPGVTFVTDIFTPVLFFGKVLDDKGNPIASANVDASFADSPFSGDTEEKLETDSRGRFWTWGHGLGVVIDVSKSGYYILHDSGGVFDYCYLGHPTNRHTNPFNPAVFVLRRMGVCEPLMERSMGGRFAKFGANGSPISLDLSEGRAYRISSEDIRIQAWIYDENVIPNSHEHYDWRVVITVPGTGLKN
jgi:hypothetical protein